MNQKQYKKVEKELGKELVAQIAAESSDNLKKRVVDAANAVQTAADELEKNSAYQMAKDKVKDLSAGLRDVKRRQGMISQLSLDVLNGTFSPGEEE